MQFRNLKSSLAVKGVGFGFRWERRPKAEHPPRERSERDERPKGERKRNQKKGTKNGKPTQSKETKNGKPTIAQLLIFFLWTGVRRKLKAQPLKHIIIIPRELC